jgi:uncharacterized membrane protein (DUF485 family)
MEHHHLTASEWDELANDPDFIALLRARRRFIVPSTILFLLFYLALPLGVAFAPAFMNQRVLGPLTLAYVRVRAVSDGVDITRRLYARGAEVRRPR